MNIAIASGKGGTGKTTIATSLAKALINAGKKVTCLDCDVEAPNAHLFLHPIFSRSMDVDLLIPKVDADLCDGCGRCAEVCEFNAILTFGQETMVFPELCHGCGSCTLVCPQNAITEVPRTLGIVESGLTKEGIKFAHGVLNIGEAIAVPIITNLKNDHGNSESEIIILDSPPGASCPVVESLKDADFVILVTEPTPFGLHDLKIAVELTQELNIPTGIVINRDGIGDSKVDEYCREANLPVLMRIPFDKEIGKGIAKGKLLVEIYPEYLINLQEMFSQIQELMANAEDIL